MQTCPPPHIQVHLVVCDQADQYNEVALLKMMREHTEGINTADPLTKVITLHIAKEGTVYYLSRHVITLFYLYHVTIQTRIKYNIVNHLIYQYIMTAKP